MILPDNLDETIPVTCNTPVEEIRANVQAACGRALPWLDLAEPHGRAALIVGGGPSMKALLPMIAALQRSGGEVFATNGATTALAGVGVVADHHVLLDARAANVAFVAGAVARHYLVASQCHPALFDALAGRSATLWHVAYPEISDWIGEREAVLIGGGTTVGLQAMSIAYALGHRKIHLFGFDSSYSAAGEGHAYRQPLNDGEEPVEYRVGDKAFMAAPWMARQAVEYQTASRQLIDGDAELYVHGTGLLPAIAAQMGKSR